MKKSILFVLLTITVSAAMAQPGKTVVKQPSPLKNITDSASYAIGISVANFYKQQGFTKINSALVTKGCDDIMSGKKPLFDEATATNVMNSYMSKVQAEKSKPTIEAGQNYLAKNKTKAGVKTTPSGLQYQVINEGNGERPGPTDSVTCSYKGTFINGTGFDSSYVHGPITFALNGVIPGWTEGLQLMSVGSKYRFYIPYNLAYGAFDYMTIPGGSALIFDVELLAVRKRR